MSSVHDTSSCTMAGATEWEWFGRQRPLWSGRRDWASRKCPCTTGSAAQCPCIGSAALCSSAPVGGGERWGEALCRRMHLEFPRLDRRASEQRAPVRGGGGHRGYTHSNAWTWNTWTGHGHANGHATELGLGTGCTPQNHSTSQPKRSTRLQSARFCNMQGLLRPRSQWREWGVR